MGTIQKSSMHLHPLHMQCQYPLPVADKSMHHKTTVRYLGSIPHLQLLLPYIPHFLYREATFSLSFCKVAFFQDIHYQISIRHL